jgi:hypothetical protein
MAEKFSFTKNGETFTAPTAEGLMQIRLLLKEQDAQAARKRVMSQMEGSHGELESHIAELAETPWTPEVFINFIDRLGNPQKSALSLLVTRPRVTDEELRKHLKVSNNQVLAGVLSGISKQAAALGIPARSVFEFENLRTAGKRRSTYSIADKFLRIATAMNWPQSPSEK